MIYNFYFIIILLNNLFKYSYPKFLNIFCILHIYIFYNCRSHSPITILKKDFIFIITISFFFCLHLVFTGITRFITIVFTNKILFTIQLSFLIQNNLCFTAMGLFRLSASQVSLLVWPPDDLPLVYEGFKLVYLTQPGIKEKTLLGKFFFEKFQALMVTVKLVFFLSRN